MERNLANAQEQDVNEVKEMLIKMIRSKHRILQMYAVELLERFDNINLAMGLATDDEFVDAVYTAIKENFNHRMGRHMMVFTRSNPVNPLYDKLRPRLLELCDE